MESLGQSLDGGQFCQLLEGFRFSYQWEARYTVGRDPSTGKRIQRSIYGTTQKEVWQKLAQITATIDKVTYQTPNKITVGAWMEEWLPPSVRTR